MSVAQPGSLSLPSWASFSRQMLQEVHSLLHLPRLDAQTTQHLQRCVRLHALSAALALGSLLALIAGLQLASLLLMGCLLLRQRQVWQRALSSRIGPLMRLQAVLAPLEDAVTSGARPLPATAQSAGRVHAALRAASLPLRPWMQVGHHSIDWRAALVVGASLLSPPLGGALGLLNWSLHLLQTHSMMWRFSKERRQADSLELEAESPAEPSETVGRLEDFKSLFQKLPDPAQTGTGALQALFHLSSAEAQDIWQQLEEIDQQTRLLVLRRIEGLQDPQGTHHLLRLFCQFPFESDQLAALLGRMAGMDWASPSLGQLFEQWPEATKGSCKRWFVVHGPELRSEIIGDASTGPAAKRVLELLAIQRFLDDSSPQELRELQLLGPTLWPLEAVEELLHGHPLALRQAALDMTADEIRQSESLQQLCDSISEMDGNLHRALQEMTHDAEWRDDPGVQWLQLVLSGQPQRAMRRFPLMLSLSEQPFAAAFGVECPRSQIEQWLRQLYDELYSLTPSFFMAESLRQEDLRVEQREVSVRGLRAATRLIEGAMTRHLPQESAEAVSQALAQIVEMGDLEDGPVSQRSIVHIARLIEEAERLPNDSPDREQVIDRLRAGLLQLKDVLASCTGSWAGNLPQVMETLRGETGPTAVWLAGKLSQQRLVIAMNTLLDWTAEHAPGYRSAIRTQLTHAMNHVRWLLIHSRDPHQRIGLPGASSARSDWHFDALPIWSRAIPPIREAILAAQTPFAVAQQVQELLNLPSQQARLLEIRGEIMQRRSSNPAQMLSLQMEAQEVLREARAFVQSETEPQAPLAQNTQREEQLLRHELARLARGQHPQALQSAMDRLRRLQGDRQAYDQANQDMHIWLQIPIHDRLPPEWEQVWRFLDQASTRLQRAGFSSLWAVLRHRANDADSIRDDLESIGEWLQLPSIRPKGFLQRLLFQPPEPSALLQELARRKSIAEAQAETGPLFPNDRCSIAGAFAVLEHLGFCEEI
jgi:hypothetical protein